MKLIKTYFRIISRLLPKLTSKQAFELFKTVRVKNIRTRELDFYNEFRKREFDSDEGKILTFEKGDSNNTPVLLVHGWDSNPGSLYKLADMLLNQGFYVVCFNLPAHGYAKEKKTNILICGQALQRVMEEYNFDQNLNIVSHSFGSAVVTYCLSLTGRKVDRLIFLTSPNSMNQIFADFAQFIHLGKKAFHYFIHRIESIIKRPVSEMDVEKLLHSVNYNQLTLIHDRKDKILPFSNSESIQKAAINAELLEIENVGHYRMLWNAEVIGWVQVKMNDFALAST